MNEDRYSGCLLGLALGDAFGGPQLRHQPAEETRNKKMLPGLKAPWEAVLPVWELRVGEYCVFYDVDEAELRVTIRAIRPKPPHSTTEDIL